MSFVFKGIKYFSETWFGGSDCYRICYTYYILAGTLTLRRKYFDKNKYFFAFFRCLQALVAAICIFCAVSFLYDAYLLRENIEKLPYTLGVTIFFIIWVCRIFILTLKKDEFEDILVEIDAHFHQEGVGTSCRDVTIFAVGKKYFKKMTAFYLFTSFVALVAKLLNHLVTERSLIIPFPFADDLGSPAFEIMITLEAIGLAYFVGVVIAQGMLVYGIFIRVLEHFIILTSNVIDIEEVFRRTETPGVLMIGNIEFNQIWMEWEWRWKQKTTSELLRKNIIHHQKIMKIMKRSNNLLQECFFIQIFGGGLLLVDLFFHVTLLKTGNYIYVLICQFIFSLVALVDITVVCYFGSEIEAKSHAAARSLSYIDWFDMDVSNRKTVRLFQQALWRHPVMKAANVFSINLNMYLKLLNSIYSFLAFVQKTLKRNE